MHPLFVQRQNQGYFDPFRILTLACHTNTRSINNRKERIEKNDRVQQ